MTDQHQQPTMTDLLVALTLGDLTVDEAAQIMPPPAKPIYGRAKPRPTTRPSHD